MLEVSFPTTTGKSRRHPPRNPRHPLPAIQQFNDQVRLVIISPNGAPARFDAAVDGQLLVTSSPTPLLDVAPLLIERGADTNSWIIMWHQDSDVDALRTKVGIAAKLIVKEPDRGRAHFARYVPLPSSPVAPSMRKTAPALVPGHAAERRT
jgi:hypothetical protein